MGDDNKLTTLKNRIKKFLLKNMISIILLILFVVFAGMWYNSVQANAVLSYQNDELKQLSKNSDEDGVTKISAETVVKTVNEIGELASIEYNYQTVGKFENSQEVNGFVIPFTEKNFLAIYDGRVKAGFNLEEIEVIVDEADKTIIILMPQAKILSHEVFEDTFEVYDQNNNIFNPIDPEDSNNLKLDTKQDLEDNLIKDGFLQEATLNAENVISKYILSLISEEYTVTFKYN